MKVSRLFYHKTKNEVRAGDRVTYTRLLFGKQIEGIVLAIPAKTADELAKINKSPESWWIKLDDGTSVGWIYSPNDAQPSKRIKFVARSSDNNVKTTRQIQEELEVADSLEEIRNGPRFDFIMMVSLIIGGIIIVSALMWSKFAV